jgi:hypothetical protein
MESALFCRRVVFAAWPTVRRRPSRASVSHAAVCRAHAYEHYAADGAHGYDHRSVAQNVRDHAVLQAVGVGLAQMALRDATPRGLATPRTRPAPTWLAAVALAVYEPAVSAAAVAVEPAVAVPTVPRRQCRQCRRQAPQAPRRQAPRRQAAKARGCGAGTTTKPPLRRPRRRRPRAAGSASTYPGHWPASPPRQVLLQYRPC